MRLPALPDAGANGINNHGTVVVHSEITDTAETEAVVSR